MLLAYLDEIGSPGAFVHPTHPRYADSPAFGYGGLVLEQSAVREFGAYSAHLKRHISGLKFLTILTPDGGRKRVQIFFMHASATSER